MKWRYRRQELPVAAEILKVTGLARTTGSGVISTPETFTEQFTSAA